MSRSWLGAIAATVAAAVLLVSSSDAQASASPGARPVPGSVARFTYGSGTSAHPYLVYTPAGYRPREKLPLLVMLHGCQTTAYEQMRASLYNPLADRRHFVVAYPDTDAVENAQPGPLTRCWQYFNPLDWQRGRGDDASVAAITRIVTNAWHVDRQRVYLMGMSSGAFLTADMAATYPDVYAAVGENAGADYADPECTLQSRFAVPTTTTAEDAYTEMGPRARVVPKIVIGGDADQGIPPACADRALAQSLRTNNLVIDHTQTAPIRLTPTSVVAEHKRDGYRYTISSYKDEHGCVIGQRYLVHGMNHFWSGGSGDPRWKTFTDPKGPSAAIASWTFFSHFTLTNTRSACTAKARPRHHRMVLTRLARASSTPR